MTKKSQSTLDRLIRNMGEHMARHPRDEATLAHARKLGIYGSVLEVKKSYEQEQSK